MVNRLGIVFIQKLVGEVLGIQQNKIYTKVKRIGGGFGGKESRGNMVILPLAVAAKKYNRPMRCIFDRDEDIMSSGGRHPFYFKYKVGFDHAGKILGAKVEMYSNCGYSYDLSTSVSMFFLLGYGLTLDQFRLYLFNSIKTGKLTSSLCNSCMGSFD